MKKLIIGVIGGLALSITALAQPASNCFSLFLPDLRGPEPTPQPIVGYYFTVQPTPGDLFYPFDITTTRVGTGMRVRVIQNVYNDPLKQSRTFENIARVSLVSWSHDIEPSVNVNGTEYGYSVTGGWVNVREKMRLLGYTIQPSPLTPPGVENTWGINFDKVTRVAGLNVPMSQPINPGEGWNVGVYAPNGIANLGLKVGVQLCPQQ